MFAMKRLVRDVANVKNNVLNSPGFTARAQKQFAICSDDKALKLCLECNSCTGSCETQRRNFLRSNLFYRAKSVCSLFDHRRPINSTLHGNSVLTSCLSLTDRPSQNCSTLMRQIDTILPRTDFLFKIDFFEQVFIMLLYYLTLLLPLPS